MQIPVVASFKEGLKQFDSSAYRGMVLERADIASAVGCCSAWHSGHMILPLNMQCALF